MVTDQQVRKLMKLITLESSLDAAAAKSGMSTVTARKYRKLSAKWCDVSDWSSLGLLPNDRFPFGGFSYGFTNSRP